MHAETKVSKLSLLRRNMEGCRRRMVARVGERPMLMVTRDRPDGKVFIRCSYA